MTIRTNTAGRNTGPQASAVRAADTAPTTGLPDNTKRWQRTARRHASAKRMAEGLARVTPSATMKKRYTATATCMQTVYQVDGEMHSRRCKQRHCAHCVAVQAEKRRTVYAPQLKQLGTLYFLTLTRPNVAHIELRDTLQTMYRTFVACARSVKRNGHAVHLLRTTEVTANVRARTFHPHIHVIVGGYATAKALLAAWMHRNPTANILAQDLRRADGSALNELMKYTAKLTGTETDADGTKLAMPYPMLDTIYTATRGLRLFSAMGLDGTATAEEPAETDETESVADHAMAPPKRPADTILWTWHTEHNDWLDHATGELLTEYEPTEKEAAWLNRLTDGLPPPPTERHPGADRVHASCSGAQQAA